MDRNEKAELVSELNGIFAEAGLVVVTHYKGLTVDRDHRTSQEMRKAGASYKVTKNRLTRRALDGTPYAGLADLFTGPTGIAYSQDPVAAAKVATDFAKKNEKFVVLGAGLGEQVLDEAGVKALASLPSLDELRGKLLGMISTPATRIAGILQQPGGSVARVLSARAAKATTLRKSLFIEFMTARPRVVQV